MRVLVLTHSYQGNGAARCLLGLMQHWTRNLGWQVDALHDGNAPDALEIRAVGANPVVDVQVSPDTYRFALVNTLVTIERFAPVMQQMPTVLWVHEGRVAMSNTPHPHRFWNELFKLPALSVFQSPWQINEMFASYLVDVPKHRVALVPNGIRAEAEAASANWQAAREARLQARQRGEPVRVMCCGSVIPRKRPHELMAAMQALSLPNTQAHFVGTLAHMGLFEDQAFQHAQADPAAFGHRYNFHGELRFEPTQALLATGDVLVSCSGDESQGMATLEAALHGLPLLLSDLECYQGIWTHGENALLFPVGATRVMAWQLNGLLQDPVLCQALGHAARQVALRYRWVEFSDGFDRALGKALGLSIA